MLSTQNPFSVFKTVAAKAHRGVTYIKRDLSIQHSLQCASGNERNKLKFRNSGRVRKMDYLRYVYDNIFGYGAENALNAKVPRKVVAFGNVLLDTTAHLKNTELLEKFNLTPDSNGELDAETITKITAAAYANDDCKKNPGGSALNTSRIIAKLGTEPAFFGAIGEDETGEELKRLISGQLHDSRLQTVSNAPTGQCIALVYDDKATLYANIGASAKFSIDFLKQQEEESFLRPIERKQIIYIEGFFIPHREEVCNYIVENYIHDRRRLAINLSGVYIVKENSEQIVKLAHDAFFIFGNQSEFEALMEVMGVKTEMDLGRELTQQGRLAKIIVITKGEKGMMVITNYDDEYQDPINLTIDSYYVERVENVVDTTGAGDAFVGAFFHYWLQKRQVSECVRLAGEVAAKVCTQVGCHLPNEDSS